MANGYTPQTQFEQFVCDGLHKINEDIKELKDGIRTHCDQQQDYGELRTKVNSMWKWVGTAVGGSALMGAITGWLSGGN